MGFVMPAVRIQDNMQLPPNGYVIRVKEIVAGRGEIRPNMLLVMDPRGNAIAIPGEPTKEPTFGLPAMWVDEAAREDAMFKGYTIVDPPTVITTHLTEIIKDNMSEMLSYSETQKLLDELGKTQQKLISDIVPSQITIAGIQRVLQSLLAERVSVRDLPAILEGIAEACGQTRNVTAITEHVRARLARQICDANTNAAGHIPIVTLSPEWESVFAESITGQGDDRQLSMPPSKLQDFIAKVRQTFERFAMMGETPVLLTSPLARPYARSIIERFRPLTTVMSQMEIHPKARIKTVGNVLAQCDEKTKIIPGHGTLATKADLKKFHDMLVATSGFVKKSIAAGKSLAEIKADPAWAAAKAEAEAAYAELIAGADFATLAAGSDDKGSAKDGGSLGAAKKGDYSKAFDDAVWADGLQPGQILPPVETEYGWHVIRFDGRKQIGRAHV